MPDPDPDASLPPSGDPGSPAPVPPPAPAPTPEPEPAAPKPSSDSNPAASVVLGGNLEEADAAELVRLRQEREELARGKKDAEMRAAQLEDENRRLKTPATPAARQKRSWLEGGTFFE